jgi:hypothetical protein
MRSEDHGWEMGLGGGNFWVIGERMVRRIRAKRIGRKMIFESSETGGGGESRQRSHFRDYSFLLMCGEQKFKCAGAVPPFGGRQGAFLSVFVFESFF